MVQKLIAILLLVACGLSTQGADLVFVRGGVIVESGDEGRLVGGDRHLLAVPWEPGSAVEAVGETWTAPQVPACVPLFSVPLGDLGSWIAMGAEPPDTALAFDSAGDRLAVGTWSGEIAVVDAWTGVELARTRLAETLVKNLAWSRDGDTLYAAEQSPDARVLALDPTTLEVRAALRLADEVDTSAPPAGDDLYGVYTLPAAYHLEVLDDGDLLVVATHGWTDGEGVRRNRARVLRLDRSFGVVAAWPAGGAADAVILATDVAGRRVAVHLSRSANGPAPEGLPLDGVQMLDLERLEPLSAVVVPPLRPWYDRSFVWQALAIANEGVAVGFGDGRVAWWEPDGEPDVLGIGTPIRVGDVAVAASVGHLVHASDRFFALTAGTNIPYGSAHPDLRPPEAHPGENALFALGRADGQWRQDWVWRGPHRLQGLTLGADGHTLVVGAGPRLADEREDLFGALLFDLDRSGAPAPLACPTDGPVFFRHATTVDGRVAVAEHPWKAGDDVRGSYRVTVLR